MHWATSAEDGTHARGHLLTVRTSAVPIPRGKAVERPASVMPITSRTLAMLNITPCDTRGEGRDNKWVMGCAPVGEFCFALVITVARGLLCRAATTLHYYCQGAVAKRKTRQRREHSRARAHRCHCAEHPVQSQRRITSGL